LYSEEALEHIRRVISGEEKLNPLLEDKLNSDENLRKYGQYAFFPELYNRIYNQNEDITVDFCNGTRGTGIIFEDSSGKFVIKPVQRGLSTTLPEEADEPKIAEFAGSINLGPKQYQTLKGYIKEEFLEGYSFPKLPPEKITKDNIYKYGLELGAGMRKMHENDFCYNDTMITDDFGKSHIIITENGLRLIDYGAAISLKDHPEYTYERAFNYGRTLPQEQMFIYLMNSEEQIMDFSKRYQKAMRSMSKEEILMSDDYFVRAGVFFWRRNSLGDLFLEGFNSEYKKR
jgi:hypothetical protein